MMVVIVDQQLVRERSTQALAQDMTWITDLRVLEQDNLKLR